MLSSVCRTSLGRRLNCCIKPNTATKAMASAAPADQPRPMPFAIARNAHESLRGALKDVKSAASAGDVATAKNEWSDFKRGLSTHMAMEDNGMFPFMDAKFDGVITSEKLGHEHSEDKKEQAEVDAAFSTGDVAKINAILEKFIADHEHHLKHEEDVLMPLTMKAGNSPAERGIAVNQNLLKPMLATGDFPFFLDWALKKLVKHKPAEAVRVFVWGLQYGSTAEEYASFLPVIKGAVPSDMFASLDKDFDLSGPGKVVL